MTAELPEQDLAEKITHIVSAAYPEVQGIYLYGSAVAGSLASDSDVDIMEN